jgi:Fe-S oxidoreductase
MRLPPLTQEQRQAAFANTKKPKVLEAQKLPVRYVVEDHPVEDRPKRFLEAFAAILKHSNYRFVLDQYIQVSAKCSRCTTNCQVYLATGDPEDIPCKRSELLLSVYRRHFTVLGMWRARLLGDPGLTDETIQKMADSYWNCTACRRCQIECPLGIDHGLIAHLARYVLSEIGIAPRALVISVREQLEGKTGNTSAIPLPAIKDTLEFLEEEMLEEKGVEIKMPLDVEGADYLFFAPVSDYLMEAETLMGIAAVMTATGGSWTIGSNNYDAINYGLFYNDQLLERILLNLKAEAERLKVKAILVGECGHASRSAKYFYPTFCGGEDALPVYNILEYTHKMLKEGRLKLDPNVVTEKVTYHDPCNIARPGWIVEQPREIVRAFCNDFVEMRYPGKDNICCGGGGGTVSIDEIRPYRTLVGGRAKAEQLKATGADIVIAPCANCKKQLRELIEDNEIPMEMMGLHDLIYKAILFPPEMKTEIPVETSEEAASGSLD